jgi:hypothetical protein
LPLAANREGSQESCYEPLDGAVRAIQRQTEIGDSLLERYRLHSV